MSNRSGGMMNEPVNQPGIAIVQTETEKSEAGQRQQQIWLHVDDGTDRNPSNAQDVAVMTTTWMAFSSMVTALIMNIAKFAMVMGAIPLHIYAAFVVLYVVLFGLWCWFSATRSQEYFWLQLSAIVAGFLFIVL